MVALAVASSDATWSGSMRSSSSTKNSHSPAAASNPAFAARGRSRCWPPTMRTGTLASIEGGIWARACTTTISIGRHAWRSMDSMVRGKVSRPTVRTMALTSGGDGVEWLAGPMTLFYSDVFVLPLPSNHQFPAGKYLRLRERLLATGEFGTDDFRVAEAASDGEILRVHCPRYLERVANGALDAKELRAIGFPWSERMVERSRRSSGATLAAAREALTRGWSANLGGGTHHAFRDRGTGYCVFNDVAIAARAMQAEAGLQRIAVVDCDVHQGNGTAAIFEGDGTVFTYSMHAAKNFPARKERS